MQYVFPSFISSALFAASQLAHWDSLLKSSQCQSFSQATQPLQEELGGFHQLSLFLELQDQTILIRIVDFFQVNAFTFKKYCQLQLISFLVAFISFLLFLLVTKIFFIDRVPYFSF